MEFNIVVKIWKYTSLIITPLYWRIIPFHYSECDYYTGKDPVILDREDRGLSAYSSDDRLKTMHRYYHHLHHIEFLCFELKFGWWHKSAWHNFPVGYNADDKKLVKSTSNV